MTSQPAEFSRPTLLKRALAIALVVVIAIGLVLAFRALRPHPVHKDWAPPGLTMANLAEVETDLFHDMDGGVALSPSEIKGRNTWMIWTAGNAKFWNWLAQYGYGTNDLLKTLDSRNRHKRFETMGLINEPGFVQDSEPDSLGVYLDKRTAPPEPVDPLGYGRASGVVGLRLFPNPKFDRSKWDGAKYYNDPLYYNNKALERPYMVGMACAFCHVGPHPLHPPADPERPEWSNLSTNIGAQYFRTATVFAGGMDQSSLVYQILRAMRDGTLDTSFLPSDNMLNPSTMNALFEIKGRLAAAMRNPAESVGVTTLALHDDQPPVRQVPHILKDGADNIGLLGALARVYINIGEYHDQWLANHNILIGGRAQTPFPIAAAQRKSIYWRSTEGRVGNLAAFFIRAATPMHLEDAPGGKTYLTASEETLARGKRAFAERCASCHSSKQPPPEVNDTSEAGKAWFRAEIAKPGFRDGNFFSDDRRRPVSLIKTNACRALGTNAMRGHVWDNFSSETYKNSPPSGPIEVYNPITGTKTMFQPRGGGPGYYRTPSLVSIWATAPYFHDNQLGEESHDPSVAGRMHAFDIAIHQLLWPERRRGVRSVLLTTAESWLQIPASYLPGFLRGLAEDGYLRIGPVPAGTPIKLLANLDATLETRALDRADLAKTAGLVDLGRKIKNRLITIKLQRLDSVQSRKVLADLVPDLLAHSKCPDFIEDKGHEFGTDLPDEDKEALIEYLKTL
jgi:hypothetical protein